MCAQGERERGGGRGEPVLTLSIRKSPKPSDRLQPVADRSVLVSDASAGFLPFNSARENQELRTRLKKKRKKKGGPEENKADASL